MNEYRFFEGQELKEIWWDGEYVMYKAFVVGKSCSKEGHTVVKITVTMEYGQMNDVPWAVVLFDDGSCVKCNLALAHGAELALKGVRND